MFHLINFFNQFGFHGGCIYANPNHCLCQPHPSCFVTYLLCKSLTSRIDLSRKMRKGECLLFCTYQLKLNPTAEWFHCFFRMWIHRGCEAWFRALGGAESLDANLTSDAKSSMWPGGERQHLWALGISFIKWEKLAWKFYLPFYGNPSSADVQAQDGKRCENECSVYQC